MTRNYNLQYFRCGWQWKDLSRFICLKIWPRLPKQSTRAIRISSSNSKTGLSIISTDEKFLYEMSKQKENNNPGNNFNKNNNIEKQDSLLEYASDVFVPQQKQVSLPPTNNINGASSDDTMHYGPMKHLIIKDEKQTY